MRLTPASRHMSIWRRAPARSTEPTGAPAPASPKLIVPSVRVEMRRPERPSWRYSMGGDAVMRRRPAAATWRSSTCEPRGERRHEMLERVVQVERDAEAAGRLEPDEAVDGAAKRPRRVDGLVAAEVPAAQHGGDDLE